MTNGTYLDYHAIPNDDKKTNTWDVCSKKTGAFLGTIKFKPQWRKYVFEPTIQGYTHFDAQCLESIAQFLHDSTQAWKARIKK